MLSKYTAHYILSRITLKMCDNRPQNILDANQYPLLNSLFPHFKQGCNLSELFSRVTDEPQNSQEHGSENQGPP